MRKGKVLIKTPSWDAMYEEGKSFSMTAFQFDVCYKAKVVESNSEYYLWNAGSRSKRKKFRNIAKAYGIETIDVIR